MPFLQECDGIVSLEPPPRPVRQLRHGVTRDGRSRPGGSRVLVEGDATGDAVAPEGAVPLPEVKQD